MTFLELVPYLSAVAVFTSLGTVWWNIYQSPAKKNAVELDAVKAANAAEHGNLRGSIELLRREVAAECKVIDDKADAIGGRVSHLETMMQQMPDKDSQHRLELSVSDMRGEFKELRADLRPVAAIAERMQELMLAESRQPASPARASSRGRT